MNNKLVENILTLQQIKGFGLATIERVAKKVPALAEMTTEELAMAIDRLSVEGSLPRVRMPDVDEIKVAGRRARSIIARSEELGIGILSRYDADFPTSLLSTVDERGKASVPVLIHYKGDISIAAGPSLAVIGTRNPTREGEMAGRHFAKGFAEKGVNIVSGLAIGCDTAGHEGALEAGGLTTAILAGGLDRIYPDENTQLARRILDNGGLLISEYPVGASSNRYTLVERDRLQAAMANATLVVQCSEHSGTMYASKATLAAGKPLLVVDYKAAVANTEGNRYLLSLGKTAEAITSDSFRRDSDRYVAMAKPKVTPNLPF